MNNIVFNFISKSNKVGCVLRSIFFTLCFGVSVIVYGQQNGLDINDPRYNVFGQTLVSTDSILTTPPVSILATERGDRTINLLIDENIHKNFYSGYYILRSTDGINFSPLNEVPYYFVEADADDITDRDPNAQKNSEIAKSRSAVYRDSVQDNSTFYYYRVVGTNNLGQTSEPSPIVKTKGRSPKMDFTFLIDTLTYNSSSDDVVIHVPEYHDSIKSNLIGYQFYKSLYHNGPFNPINGDLLPTSIKSYTDIDPFSTGYYVLVSWDKEGHEYKTYPSLMQLPDSIPPPVPKLLNATYTELEKVRIVWDDVFAEDLNGYYLYFANGKNGEYNPVNSEPIKDTTLIHDFQVGMEIDSIFFKVSSIDSRGNISNSSDPLGIKRPGKYGASSPILHSITPNAEKKGLKLSFTFSPDDDIKYHKLERRSASDATWSELIRILPKEQEIYPQGPDKDSYIDSTYIRSEELEYRLMVIDQEDLVTSSEVITAFPMNNQSDGYINQLKVRLSSTPVSLPPLSQFQSPVMGQLPTETKNSIVLSWVYDLTPRLEGFILYRGLTGGHLIEYRTVPKKDLIIQSVEGGKKRFVFTDASLVGKKRYTYKVMAQHYDGSTSHMSNAVSLKIN